MAKTAETEDSNKFQEYEHFNPEVTQQKTFICRF